MIINYLEIFLVQFCLLKSMFCVKASEDLKSTEETHIDDASVPNLETDFYLNAIDDTDVVE